MSQLQLTPIGTSPAWYNAGEANSGFLVEVDGFRLLIDCGSGVISRYLELYGPDQPIDAIVLSHVHADHSFDVVPLKFGISMGALDWKPQLWLPPNARQRLTRLISTWERDLAATTNFDFFTDTFDVHDYEPGRSFEVGPLRMSSIEVPHYVESFALRVQHGTSSLGYTADLGPTPLIAPFMSGVDVLLAEAALDEAADLSAPDRGHITASEAGQIAAEAGAGRLLLTHVPEELGFERALAAAAAEFAGSIELARSGEAYVIAQVARSVG